MEYVDEKRAEVNKLTIEIGEGRTLDDRLLQQMKEVALSSMAFSPGEQEFFLKILKQPDLDKLEDWQLIKFINVAEKANVKIILLGKPHLQIQSTETSQQQLIKKLKECYLQGDKTKLYHVFEDRRSAQDISEAYVNLAIVTNQSEESGNRREEKVDESEEFLDKRANSSYEQIYGKKEDLPLFHMFSQLQEIENDPTNKIPKRLLIEGWAGIGKTVLCQYLTIMWARDIHEKKNQWWPKETQVVLWIRLRNLSKYDPRNCCLGEVVRRECFGVEDSKNPYYPSAIQIEADLEALGDKVVMLLDGYDEVAEWYEEYEKESDQILTARSDLLKYELLGERHKHRVILTSRPSRVTEIVRLFDRRLETVGFKDDDIKGYIQNFFKEDISLGALLLANMKQNGNLWGIAHIPVNLALICLVWKESKSTIQNDNEAVIFPTMTMTTLYSNAVLWLLRRDWIKHPLWNPDDLETRRTRMAALGEVMRVDKRSAENVSESARELTMEDFESKLIPYATKIKLLEELAWKAETSKQHSLLISGEQVVECLQKYYHVQLKDEELQEILVAIGTLGLLESQYKEGGKKVRENYYYFPHLTFQEYFAAKYWVRLYCSEKKEERDEAEQLFKLYKFQRQYEIVWWFVSGLLSKKNRDTLILFLELFKCEPHDITGFKEIGLLIRCLEESYLPLMGSSQLEILIDEVIKWIIWLIDQDSTEYTVLYDIFNLSSGIFSHPKINRFLIQELSSIQDLSITYFFKIIRFLNRVFPKHPELLMTIFEMLGNASEDVQARFISDAIKQFPFLTLEKKQMEDFIVKLLNMIDSGNQLRKICAIKITQNIPLEKLNEDLTDKLMIRYVESSNQTNKELQKDSLEAIAKMLSKLLYQRDYKRFSIIFESYLIYLKSKDNPLQFRAFELLSTFICDQLDDKQMSTIVNICVDGFHSDNHSVRCAVINALLSLPWMKLIEKQNILIDGFVFALSNNERDGSHLTDMVRSTALRIFPKLSWGLFNEQTTDKLVQSCFDLISDKDKLISDQATRVLIALISEYSIDKSSIDKLVEICKQSLHISQSNIYASLRIVSVLFTEQIGMDNVSKLMDGCIERFNHPDRHVQHAAESAILAFSWERFPGYTSDKLKGFCINGLKDGNLLVRTNAILLVPIILKTHKNDDNVRALVDTCISFLKSSDEQLLVKLAVIKIFTQLPPQDVLVDSLLQELVNVVNFYLRKINFNIYKPTLEALDRLPWNLLNAVQIKSLLESFVEVFVNMNPKSIIRPMVTNALYTNVLKRLNKKSFEIFLTLVEKYLDELDNNDANKLLFLSFLIFIPKETFSIKQIEKVTLFCLYQLGLKTINNSVVLALKNIPWWRYFEQQSSLNPENPQEYIFTLLQCCLYSRAAAYIQSFDNNVLFNIQGNEFSVRLNVNIQFFLDEARARLNLPVMFENKNVVPNRRSSLSNSKSRFSFEDNKDNAPDDDVTNAKAGCGCTLC